MLDNQEAIGLPMTQDIQTALYQRSTSARAARPPLAQNAESVSGKPQETLEAFGQKDCENKAIKPPPSNVINRALGGEPINHQSQKLALQIRQNIRMGPSQCIKPLKFPGCIIPSPVITANRAPTERPNLSGCITSGAQAGICNFPAPFAIRG